MAGSTDDFKHIQKTVRPLNECKKITWDAPQLDLPSGRRHAWQTQQLELRQHFQTSARHCSRTRSSSLENSLDSIEKDLPVFSGSSDGNKSDVPEDFLGGMHHRVSQKSSAGVVEEVSKAQQIQRQKMKSLSSSCPMLDSSTLSLAPVTKRTSQLQTGENDTDGMLHKSMLNLTNIPNRLPIDNAESDRDLIMPSDARDPASKCDIVNDGLTENNCIKICIDYVSGDGQADSIDCEEDDLNFETFRRQKRRSSWCPENERKKDEKEEVQRMLGIGGRSQSLSSLDSQEDSDDSSDDNANNNLCTISSSVYHGQNTKVPVNANLTSIVWNLAVTDNLQDDTPGYLESGALLDIPNGRSQTANNNCPSRWLSSISVDQPQAVVYNHKNPDSTGAEVFHRTDTLDAVGQNRDLSELTQLNNGSFCAPDCALGTAVTDLTCPTIDLVSRHQSDGYLQKFQPKDDRETRRKGSVFSKFNSYRKKAGKQTKPGIVHRFVAVSFSNSTTCDVCGKFLTNKPALQCENCTVNVHDSSCRDQVVACPRRRTSFSKDDGNASRNRNDDDNDSDFIDGPLHLMSIATNIAVKSRSLPQYSAHSTESLEDDSTDHQYDKLESMLTDSETEAEAWSVTVDVKTLKKMTSKDIKRQNLIWELIQNEKHHYRILRMISKVFVDGMRKEVGLSRELIEQMFPKLDDLILIHSTFLYSLIRQQNLKPDRSIDNLSSVLLEQFDGHMGSLMKLIYGEFCSRHTESVNLYKELKRTDRKFQSFLEKCSRNSACERREIDSCILTVTQRLTKYPLLIEQIINSTKDNKIRECEDMSKSLTLIRDIITSVDRQVERVAKQRRLEDIYNKLDPKSVTMYKGNKIKKSDVQVQGRSLQFDGHIKWKSARGKSTEVLAVVLSDIIVFLVENNQKYTFCNQDNKSSIVPLLKLLVREKDDTRDGCGIFLICPRETQAEMYELVCKSGEERKTWISELKQAVSVCSKEGDMSVSPNNRGSTLDETQILKLNQLIDGLQRKDNLIKSEVEEKMKIIAEMLEIFSKKEELSLNSIWCPEESTDEASEPTDLMNVLLQEETRLLEAIKQANIPNYSPCTRSLFTSESLAPPKRAETFGGFERKDKDMFATSRKRNSSGYSEDEASSPHNSLQNLSDGIVINFSDHSNDVKALRRASLAITPTSSEGNTNTMMMSGWKHLFPKQTCKSSRRMSANLLPNMLSKFYRDKDHVRHPSGNQSVSEIDDSANQCNSSPTVKSQQVPGAPFCDSLNRIIQHVHGLINIAAQQTTEVKRLRTNLTEANNELSKLRGEGERRMSNNRPAFVHDKQLEELRNLQGQVQKERTDLQTLKEKQYEDFYKQETDIRQQMLALEKQKAEMKVQKDELQRQKDTLQCQIDMFEKQKLNFSKGSTSFDWQTSPPIRERSESPLGSSHQSVRNQVRVQHSFVYGHPTADATTKDQQMISGRTDSSNSAEEKTTLGAGTAGSTGTLRKESIPLPIHLLSATNETRLGQVTNQVPVRLAPSLDSKTSIVQQAGKNSSGSVAVKQMLPKKLASEDTTAKPDNNPVSNKDSPRTNDSTSRLNVQPTGLLTTKSQPSLQPGITKTTPGNILPMHLAVRSRPSPSSNHSTAKSASSSSQPPSLGKSTLSYSSLPPAFGKSPTPPREVSGTQSLPGDSASAIQNSLQVTPTSGKGGHQKASEKTIIYL